MQKKLALKPCTLLCFLAFASFVAFSQEESPPEASLAPTVFRYPVGGLTIGSPTATEDGVCLLSHDGAVYALSDSGKIQFRTEAGKQNASLYSLFSGQIVVAYPDGKTLVFNRAGKLSYSLELPGQLQREALQGSDGRLYFLGKSLVCTSMSGERKWEYNFTSQVSYFTLNANGTEAYVFLQNGNFLRISPYGTLIDERTLSLEIVKAISYEDFIIALDTSGTLHRFYLKNNTKTEDKSALSGVKDFCASTNKNSFYALTKSAIHKINVNLNHEKESTNNAGDGATLILGNLGVTVVGLNRVSAYNHDLELRKELVTKNASALPALSSHGIVYSIGKDWILYAYSFDPLFVASKGTSADYSQKEVAKPYFLGLDNRLESIDGRKYLLDSVEKNIKSGTIGEGEEEAFALSAYVLSLSRNPAPENATPKFRTSASERMSAATILGQLGTIEARRVLIEAFANDTDLAVKAACAEALGKIGADPDGAVSRVFADYVPMMSIQPNERLASAMIDAISALYRTEGQIKTNAAIRVFFTVMEGSYPSYLQEKARLLLARISKGTY